MLRVVNLEEIEQRLSGVPALVDLHQRRSAHLEGEVKEWLEKMEKTLENNRLSVVGQVSALRGELISSERSSHVNGNGNGNGKRITRKDRQATAIHLLRGAVDIVSSAIAKDQDRIEDARRLCRQLVAVAAAKGVIQPYLNGQADRTEVLRACWKALGDDNDLKPGVVNVEGVVGPHDALVLLDRIMTSDL